MPVQGSVSITFDMKNEQSSTTDSLQIPEVLFVCVHNAGRSQMAAGLVTLRSEGHIRVRSAGSAPADAVNPLVVEAMAELGGRSRRRLPKAAHARLRARRRRGDHHGMRRCVSDLPGQALRGLGAR